MNPPEQIGAADACDSVISGLRSRIIGAMVARQVVLWLTGFFFLCGVVVIVVRQAGWAGRPVLFWALLGAVPAMAVGVWMGLRRLPTRATVRALIDQHNGCGGLLVARGEADTGLWEHKVGSLSRLGVRWKCGPAVSALFVGLLFVAGAYAVPDGLVASPSTRMDVSRQVNALNEQIDLLEVEQVIEEAEARDLRERLDEVGEQARGQDPAKTWEAMDHLNELVGREADEAAEQALRLSQQLQEARTLEDAIARGADGMDPQLRQEAMAELAEQLEVLGELSAQMSLDSLDEALLEQLAEQAREMGLDAQQAGELAEMLAGQQEKLEAMMEQLADAGLIDPRQLEEMLAAGEIDGEGLMEFLAQQAGEDSEEMDALLRSFCAGRGGTEQGEGDTDMTWRDPASEDGAGFSPEVLPPASLESMLDSHAMGASQRDPETDTEASGSAGGALDGAQAGGGGGTTQQVLPRHRQAVRDYFDRGDSDDAPPATPDE